jgi:hypothetical protein
MDIHNISLPRALEASGQAHAILKALSASLRPLHSGSAVEIPCLAFTIALRGSLLRSRRSGRLARGFEAAKELLSHERQGLARLDSTTAQTHGRRVSRIMLLSRDGSERFYKEAGLLISRHRPRLLACLVDADSSDLGQLLFGANTVAKCILITHKDAVAQTLVSLVAGPPASPPGADA